MDEKDLRITKMSATKSAIEFIDVCLKHNIIKNVATHKDLFKYVIAYERQMVKEILKKEVLK